MQPTEVELFDLLQESQTQGTSPINKGLVSQQVVAMRSIHRGIKRNDITMILGSLNTSNLAPIRYDENLYDEEKEVHVNLGLMKKEFDTYHSQVMKKEKEVNQFRNQIHILKLEQDELQLQNGQLTQELIQSRIDCEAAKLKFEEAQMTDKSYKHVLNRLKHDILCFKLKLNQMKEILEKKKSEYHHADAKQQQSVQYNQMTQKLLDEMMKNIEMEHKDREKQLLLFKNQIKQRQIAEKKRDERIHQQMEIAEHASNDKDQNEKKWRKLLLTHKFVHCLLKNKMEKEMAKFGVVEQAFQQIKTATGITEAQDVVQKFLSKEQIYGQLLGTIAESEKNIEHLKRKNETISAKLQQLKDEVQVMEMSVKPSKKGLDSDLYKSLYAVDEKAKKAEVMQQKLYVWTIRMLSKFEVSSSANIDERTNYYDQFPRTQFQELFKYFQEKVIKEIDAMKPEEIKRVLSDLKRQNIRDETLLEDYNKRNVRVKFKKTTHRENLKRTKSIDSSIDLSNKSQSQIGQSSDSSASQSYYDSVSEENSVDEGNEVNHFSVLRDEIKVIAKKKKKEDSEKKLQQQQQN